MIPIVYVTLGRTYDTNVFWCIGKNGSCKVWQHMGGEVILVYIGSYLLFIIVYID